MHSIIRELPPPHQVIILAGSIIMAPSLSAQAQARIAAAGAELQLPQEPEEGDRIVDRLELLARGG